MNLKDFKSGTYKQQYQYKSFYPAKINHTWYWDDPKINVLLEQATRSLGELNAFSLIVPDIDLFIQMHKVKEANTSSRIEGTRTNIEEALLHKEFVDPEKRDDWEEVQNYIKAINQSIQLLETIPLSTRLLKEAHKVLMQGVRGEHKQPGEFRQSQNWIGGSSISDAAYIPPHQTDISELMSDLEKFWHNEQIEVPHLVKIAISHYQFEAIHPFLDGNGRIGRLLITLYFVSHKILQEPCLYISDFFEKNRAAYYDALARVQKSNDLALWIKFFLNAVIHTAENGKNTFQSILKLRTEAAEKIISLGRKAENANKILEYLYKQPSITIKDVSDYLDITPNTASKLINDLVTLKILEEITGYQRNRIFEFPPYLKLFTD